MERFSSLYNQYEAKRIETSALGSQILGDEDLFKEMVRELVPELFEKQPNDRLRYTYLNKLIDKYQHNSAIPKLPGAQFGGGHGTAEDPYKIATYQHFLEIPDNTDKNYIQTADIKFPDNAFPNSIKCFNGTYDGQGYMITAEGTQSNSLFGTITQGTVKNILIYGVNVVTSNNTGVVCNSLVGNIDNVKLLECNITITSVAVHHGGLLTANMLGGKISFCSANVFMS